MKIIKIKKPLENCELQDLQIGDSMRENFEITVEDDPEQKYLGRLSIERLSEENQGKTKRKFAIKKLKYIETK